MPCERRPQAGRRQHWPGSLAVGAVHAGSLSACLPAVCRGPAALPPAGSTAVGWLSGAGRLAARALLPAHPAAGTHAEGPPLHVPEPCKGARMPGGLHDRAATASSDHGVPIAMVQEQRQAALPLHSCKPRWAGSTRVLIFCPPAWLPGWQRSRAAPRRGVRTLVQQRAGLCACSGTAHAC